jgi:hypothetical protein
MPAVSPSEAGGVALPSHHRPVMLSVWEGPSHSETHPASGIDVSSGQKGTQATKTIANQSKPEGRRPWHCISRREEDRYTSCPLYLITTRNNSWPVTPKRLRLSVYECSCAISINCRTYQRSDAARPHANKPQHIVNEVAPGTVFAHSIRAAWFQMHWGAVFASGLSNDL